MYKQKRNDLEISDICNYLNKKAVGDKDYIISNMSNISDAVDGSVTFVDQITNDELLKIDKKILILTNRLSIEDDSFLPELIFTDAPEKDFYIIVKEFFIEKEVYSIDDSVVIPDSSKLGVNVNIGKGTIIGDDVEIGNDSYIGRNVIINEKIKIGNGCYIKDNSIIGSNGFKFINEDNNHTNIPFMGELVIQDGVLIGSMVIIERPLIGKAEIKKDVKIDDLVQIGSDCNIGEHCQFAAGTVLGRNVKIGSNCNAGINSIIKPDLTIGDNTNIGMGAVVVKDLDSNKTYIGNPAVELDNK